MEDLSIVISGVGAAGVAIGKILLGAGAGEIVGVDSMGAVYNGRDGLNAWKQWFAENTNPHGKQGALSDVMAGADVFIGVSAPDVLTVDDIKAMNDDPIVFAMANPDPEIRPELVGDLVRVMGTGRSDYPNQINNVLAFPGIFRGALDARASDITEGMKLAAAEAIAESVSDEDLTETNIMPSVFDRSVSMRSPPPWRPLRSRTASVASPDFRRRFPSTAMHPSDAGSTVKIVVGPVDENSVSATATSSPLLRTVCGNCGLHRADRRDLVPARNHRVARSPRYVDCRRSPSWRCSRLTVYERWSRGDIVRRLLGEPVGIGRAVTIHDVGTAVSKGVPLGGALGTALRWSISRNSGVRPPTFASMLIAYGIATTFATWLLPLAALLLDLTQRPADTTDLVLLGVITAVLVGSVVFWTVVLRSDRLESWTVGRTRRVWAVLARRVPALDGQDPATRCRRRAP